MNNDDHSISERVLLNLRTSQTFENVLTDLGQVTRVNSTELYYIEVARFKILSLPWFDA